MNFMGQLSDTQTMKEDLTSFCDRPISVGEVLPAIQRLKLSNSPETDELTSEFYITFADQLGPFTQCVH